jgi:rRNA maturation protein Nop10
MKLRKCPVNHYTLKELCPICNKATIEAHYKYIKAKNQKGISSS